MIGYLFEKEKPVRYESKFYIPYEIYNRTYYPPYVNGPFIAISEKTMNKICSIIDEMKSVLFIDDVYFGLLMEYAKNIEIKEISDKCVPFYPGNFKRKIDEYKRKVIYVHPLMPGAINYYIR